MATYVLRHVTPDAIAAAKQRARNAGTSLDDVLRAYLEQYAAGETAQQKGGQARAQSLTADERSDSARRAAEARWSQK
jgi:hypothetical protein